MSVLQILKQAAHQKAFPSLIFQRSIHLTPESKNNFAEALADKFVDQVKKQRQHKHLKEPTPFVQIESLPNSTTSEDILKLAREAFPKGDQSIVETVFCRNAEFNFNGRCVLSLSSVEDARRLVEYGNRRVLGGRVLKMNYIDNKDSDKNEVLSKYRRPELFSITDSSSAAGRSVVISGLPSKTQPEHVLGYLRARQFYPVKGTTDGVLKLKSKEGINVSKFLVKFDSESEAWRCVRSFHNTNFELGKIKRQFKLYLTVAY